MLVAKDIFSKYKILAAAILISCGWHFFWISAVRIVSSSGSEPPVRFSKVLFLGPILGQKALEVRVGPKSRDLLEKRYLAVMNRSLSLGIRLPDSIDMPYARESTLQDDYGKKTGSFINEELCGPKLGP